MTAEVIFVENGCRYCGAEIRKSQTYCQPRHRWLDRYARKVAAVCGTEAGANRHRRDNEEPCRACKDAEAEAARRRRAVKRKTEELTVALRPQEWMDRAICADTPDFTDWPADEQLAACRNCPVRTQCLKFAVDVERHLPLSHVENNPIYGGQTGTQRANARRAAA